MYVAGKIDSSRFEEVGASVTQPTRPHTGTRAVIVKTSPAQPKAAQKGRGPEGSRGGGPDPEPPRRSGRGARRRRGKKYKANCGRPQPAGGRPRRQRRRGGSYEGGFHGAGWQKGACASRERGARPYETAVFTGAKWGLPGRGRRAWFEWRGAGGLGGGVSQGKRSYRLGLGPNKRNPSRSNEPVLTKRVERRESGQPSARDNRLSLPRSCVDP